MMKVHIRYNKYNNHKTTIDDSVDWSGCEFFFIYTEWINYGVISENDYYVFQIVDGVID